MKDRIHIRNAETAQLARRLARRTGKTIGEVVLEALRQYRPSRVAAKPEERMVRWRRLLREDRENRRAEPEIPVEALYNESMGLPE